MLGDRRPFRPAKLRVIVYADAAATLGFPCAVPGKECAEDGRCRDGDEHPCFARDDGTPYVFRRCPVLETYEDPWISGVLHLRRLHALGFQLREGEWSAWVTNLWIDLEGLQAEKRREEDRQREAAAGR